MRALNRVELIGNLGQDPELRYTQSGDAVANLSLATSEVWTDKSTGERHEQTEWHRCVLWRRLAEIAGEYLSKGARVYLAGSLKTRKWQDQSGQDRYTTEIQVLDLIMLDGRVNDAADAAGMHPSDMTCEELVAIANACANDAALCRALAEQELNQVR